MPFAVAGAGIAAAGSLIGGSLQSSAVDKSSKAAIAAQQNAQQIALANYQNTLTAVGPRLEAGGQQAQNELNHSNGEATRQLYANYGLATDAVNQGYDSAGQALGQGYTGAKGYLGDAWGAIGQGTGQANELLSPYIQQGQRALQMTGDLSGANGVDAGNAALANFQKSPGYQFALDQGLQAVDAGAAARGMLVSGQTRAAEMKYGQGLASQDFASYYNRLSGLASQGLQASNQAGSNIMQGAAGQSAVDRALAGNETSYGAAQSTLDTGRAAGLGSLYTGLGGQVAGNEMTTGGRLASNEQQTGANISNLYTQNATQVGSTLQNTASGVAQTNASTGTALAGIYGSQTQGLTNAINSGLNNYTYLNQLGPQATQQQPYSTVSAGSYSF
jgi:hypothetical protein